MGSDLEDITRLAKRCLARPLTPKENLKLRQAQAQLTQYDGTGRNIFIVGSYDEGDKWKLEMTKNVLQDLSRNQNESEEFVFLMDEIPGSVDRWINAELKFRSLADFADIIVCVVEHDRGGFMFESGIISTEPAYTRKAIVLKRKYESDYSEKEEYSFMQSKGFFQKMENHHSVYEWEDTMDLFDICSLMYERF